MSKIPDNVLNPKLYKKAKEEADKKFEDKTSAYKSMWISKKYKDLGGKYSGKKKSLTSRWREEEWIQIEPYVNAFNIHIKGEGKIVEGGKRRRESPSEKNGGQREAPSTLSLPKTSI